MSDTSWMKKANAILRRHRVVRDGMLMRFGVTLFPWPSIAVSIYEEGEKITEFHIRDLPGFISDLNTVLMMIRENTDIQQRRRSDEDEDEEEERTESRSSRRSRSRSSSRRSRRTVRRD